MKNWLTILALIISALALFVSFKSCQAVKEANKIAGDSNKIARNALKQSEETLVKTERPYLNVTIEQFKDLSFFKVSRKESNRLDVRFRFKLSNVGRSPAKSISTPQVAKLTFGPPNIPLQKTPYFIISPPRITLGPEESQNMDFTLQFGGEKSELQRFLDLLESDKVSFEGQMVLFYKGIHSASQYKTRVRVRVKKTRVVILDKQME